MNRGLRIQSWRGGTRLAIYEDGHLVELRQQRKTTWRRHDIFKGRVKEIAQGLQAAFLNIGEDRAAYLHTRDLPAGLAGQPIEQQLQKGQDLLVQLTRLPRDQKGPRVTTRISLPGRALVYLPDQEQLSISRRITDSEKAERLRQILTETLIEGEGVIVRTVARNASAEELLDELQALRSEWQSLHREARTRETATRIWRGPDILGTAMAELPFSTPYCVEADTSEMLEAARKHIQKLGSPTNIRLELGSALDFEEIEGVATRAERRRVNLKCGGSILIDELSTLTAIDVDSGSYTGGQNQEENILRVNLEAAQAIANELRLRGIGGLIVVDFIDMAGDEGRQEVEATMTHALGTHRAKSVCTPISELGLMEISRQRLRTSLKDETSQPCQDCRGRGFVPRP